MVISTKVFNSRITIKISTKQRRDLTLLPGEKRSIMFSVKCSKDGVDNTASYSGIICLEYKYNLSKSVIPVIGRLSTPFSTVTENMITQYGSEDRRNTCMITRNLCRYMETLRKLNGDTTNLIATVFAPFIYTSIFQQKGNGADLILDGIKCSTFDDIRCNELFMMYLQRKIQPSEELFFKNPNNLMHALELTMDLSDELATEPFNSLLRVMFDDYMSPSNDASSSAALLFELCNYFHKKEGNSECEQLRIFQSILSDNCMNSGQDGLVILIRVLQSMYFGSSDVLKRCGNIMEAIIQEQTDKAFTSHTDIDHFCAVNIINKFQLASFDEINGIMQYLTDIKETSPLESVHKFLKAKHFDCDVSAIAKITETFLNETGDLLMEISSIKDSLKLLSNQIYHKLLLVSVFEEVHLCVKRLISSFNIHSQFAEFDKVIQFFITVAENKCEVTIPVIIEVTSKVVPKPKLVQQFAEVAEKLQTVCNRIHNSPNFCLSDAYSHAQSILNFDNTVILERVLKLTEMVKEYGEEKLLNEVDFDCSLQISKTLLQTENLSMEKTSEVLSFVNEYGILLLKNQRMDLKSILKCSEKLVVDGESNSLTECFFGLTKEFLGFRKEMMNHNLMNQSVLITSMKNAFQKASPGSTLNFVMECYDVLFQCLETRSKTYNRLEYEVILETAKHLLIMKTNKSERWEMIVQLSKDLYKLCKEVVGVHCKEIYVRTRVEHLRKKLINLKGSKVKTFTDAAADLVDKYSRKVEIDSQKFQKDLADILCKIRYDEGEILCRVTTEIEMLLATASNRTSVSDLWFIAGNTVKNIIPIVLPEVSCYKFIDIVSTMVNEILTCEKLTHMQLLSIVSNAFVPVSTRDDVKHFLLISQLLYNYGTNILQLGQLSRETTFQISCEIVKVTGTPETVIKVMKIACCCYEFGCHVRAKNHCDMLDVSQLIYSLSNVVDEISSAKELILFARNILHIYKQSFGNELISTMDVLLATKDILEELYSSDDVKHTADLVNVIYEKASELNKSVSSCKKDQLFDVCETLSSLAGIKSDVKDILKTYSLIHNGIVMREADDYLLLSADVYISLFRDSTEKINVFSNAKNAAIITNNIKNGEFSGMKAVCFLIDIMRYKRISRDVMETVMETYIVYEKVLALCQTIQEICNKENSGKRWKQIMTEHLPHQLFSLYMLSKKIDDGLLLRSLLAVVSLICSDNPVSAIVSSTLLIYESGRLSTLLQEKNDYKSSCKKQKFVKCGGSSNINNKSLQPVGETNGFTNDSINNNSDKNLKNVDMSNSKGAQLNNSHEDATVSIGNLTNISDAVLAPKEKLSIKDTGRFKMKSGSKNLLIHKKKTEVSSNEITPKVSVATDAENSRNKDGSDRNHDTEAIEKQIVIIQKKIAATIAGMERQLSKVTYMDIDIDNVMRMLNQAFHASTNIEMLIDILLQSQMSVQMINLPTNTIQFVVQHCLVLFNIIDVCKCMWDNQKIRGCLKAKFMDLISQIKRHLDTIVNALYDDDAQLLRSLLENNGIKLKLINHPPNYTIEGLDETAFHPYVRHVPKDLSTIDTSATRHDLSGNIKIATYMEESRNDIPENLGLASSWLGKGHSEADCLETKITNIEAGLYEVNMEFIPQHTVTSRTNIISAGNNKPPIRTTKKQLSQIGTVDSQVTKVKCNLTKQQRECINRKCKDIKKDLSTSGGVNSVAKYNDKEELPHVEQDKLRYQLLARITRGMQSKCLHIMRRIKNRSGSKRPEPMESLKFKFVFLVDNSGSMNGGKMTLALSILIILLETMKRMEYETAVVRFGGEAKSSDIEIL